MQAVRALYSNTANDGQQRIALDWIMEQAARVHDLAYFEGEDGRRDSDFALGRQYVGHVIREMLIPATLEIARKRDAERKRGVLHPRGSKP